MKFIKIRVIRGLIFFMSLQEKIIYNTLLDSMFSKSLDYENIESKKTVANRFKISVTQLDSIYFKVKYWIKY